MPLVEREALVDALHTAQALASRGHGRVVLVSGEAGSGKTALVRAALPGAMWGYCEPLTTPRPLGPFRDIASELWPKPPSRSTPLGMADRLLQRLSEPGPAIVIEDAHWIDSASADVVRFLGRRLDATHGLLVVISRNEAAHASALLAVIGELAASDVLTRIDIPALTPAGVARLTKDTGLDVAETMRLTGGNALLVSQLSSGTPGDSTGSLREAIAARMVRLASDARALAEALSVIPARIPAAALTDSEWGHIDELIAAGLLTVVDRTVEFRHELVRLSIEDGLPAGRRRALHDLALARFRDLPGVDPAQLAHHARHANRPDLALAAETEAARRAAALGSHSEAAAHFGRAVDDAKEHAAPAEHVRLLLACAVEESAIGNDRTARDLARQALQESIATAEPLLHSAAARVTSRFEPAEDRAYELARVAVELCEPIGVTAELAAAYANLASNRMLARELHAASGHARRALELSPLVQDDESEIIASNALGSVQLLMGDPTGEAHLRRAIHLAAAYGNEPEVARAYANLVSAAGEARNYELSAKATREALSYFIARDLDGMAAYTRAWHARCLFEQGRWPEADEILTLLSGSIQLNSITRLIISYLTARLIVRRGGPDPAPALRNADELATSMGSLQRCAPVAAAQSEAHWLTGNPMDVGRLAEVYELATRRADSWTIGELGFWLWRLGRLTRLPDNAAAPYRLHVDGDFAAAADAWTALGCPYEAADALSDSADEGQLRRALEVFSRLGATPQWQRTARRLREMGVRSIPRGPNASTNRNPDGLTPREAEILTWLATGHSDGQIAQALHLSVRTVEHHVAAILRKKAASSRRDLIVR